MFGSRWRKCRIWCRSTSPARATRTPLVAELGRGMLMEDSGFHSFQIVDAGFNQYQSRRGTESGRHVLIGMARFLAAHAPTPRAVGQTYQIALRLHRGEEIFRDQ